MRNIAASIFCIIGGILMIIASIIGSAAIYELIVEFLSIQFPDYKTFLRIFLAVCIFIAAGGGISVIIGVIIAFKSLAPGKFLIGLGAGMGLIGLIIFIVTGIIAGTITGTVTDIIIGLLLGPASYGIIGVFMTIFARRAMAKGKKKED
ncbi:MAG: hypothetical protein ACFE8A_14705 [Candidatus Hodarchaeota archaeon]